MLFEDEFIQTNVVREQQLVEDPAEVIDEGRLESDHFLKELIAQEQVAKYSKRINLTSDECKYNCRVGHSLHKPNIWPVDIKEL